MTAAEAWRRGWAVQNRHPWIALIPILGDLLRLGLAWLGLPLGPVAGAARMFDPAFRMFYSPDTPTRGGVSIHIPSVLPTLGDLRVPLQPASWLQPVHTGPLTLLAGLLLLPLLEAFLTGLYLSLLGEKVTGRAVGWRCAVRAAGRGVPGLFVLFLGLRLAIMLLPWPWLGFILFLLVAVFPLLPFAVAVRGMTLREALGDTPGGLWNRIEVWVGLVFRGFLAMVIYSAVWAFFGRPVWLAMLTYPLLATGIAGGAVALYLRPGGDPDPEPENATWAWTIPVCAAAAVLAAVTVSQWEGWAPTRRAALTRDEFAVIIPYSVPSGGQELVMYRSEGLGQAGLARLVHNRFGWRVTAQQPWFGHPRPDTPAWWHAGSLHAEGHRYEWFIWGEIFHPAAAYLEVDGKRFAVGHDGPYFIISLGLFEGGGARFTISEVRLLDADGQPLGPVERGPR